MDVQLIRYTPDALETLIFTKSTRLNMSATMLDDIREWPEEKKMAELEYMLGTIQSSWEFVDYIFLISGVTRAFTHQLVRHRVGTSFAQQAQRVVNMEGFAYLATGTLADDGETSTERTSARETSPDADNAKQVYDATMHLISEGYKELLWMGVKPQDARGVLPTNVLTNIVFKANLRTLHDMGLKRLCVKAQGEFQDVFRLMRDRVIEVHPWTEKMIRVACAFSGVCAFPGVPVGDCHVKPHVFNPATALRWDGTYKRPATAEQIHQIWKSERREIQPVIKSEDKVNG